MIIKNNEKLGKEVRAMEKGQEFVFETTFGNYNCVKLSDEYVASENAKGDLIIFDVFENCLSLGNYSQCNYNAVLKMALGVRVNMHD